MGSKLGRARRDGHCRRQSGGHFARESGTGDHRHRHACAQDLRGHFMQESAAGRLQALGRPGQAMMRLEMRRQVAQQSAKTSRWRHQQYIIGAGYRRDRIRHRLQQLGKTHLAQIPPITTLARHRRHLRGIARPQQSGVAVTGQQHGQCRAPRTGAQHGDGTGHAIAQCCGDPPPSVCAFSRC